MHSTPRRICLALIASIVFAGLSEAREPASSPKALRVLVVAGGCCHDYATQTKLLKESIEARVHAEVTIVFNASKSTETTFKIYKKDDWAEGYDCILHDECSAKVMDKDYVRWILNAHKNGVPAVNLHCAMHSYRWGDFRQPVEIGADNAGWYEMLGVQSTGHGPQSPIEVSYEKHPITMGLKDWITINEELYNNVRVYGATTVLASGKQTQQPRKRELEKNPNAKPKVSQAVVAWVNEYGPKKTRIFSTSLGHNNDTVGDEKYLDLVVRGLLWATGNLDSSGKPNAAYTK